MIMHSSATLSAWSLGLERLLLTAGSSTAELTSDPEVLLAVPGTVTESNVLGASDAALAAAKIILSALSASGVVVAVDCMLSW